MGATDGRPYRRGFGLSTHTQKTVLVIDDDDALRGLMASMLERMGFDVLLAGNGKQAIEIAENHEGKIDIAFMDLFLPDMRGDKISPEIARRHPEARLVVMSGYNLTDTNILNTEVHGFLQKPCTFETLSRIISAVG